MNLYTEYVHVFMIVCQLLVHGFFHVPFRFSFDTEGPFLGTQTALFQHYCYLDTIEIEEGQ